MVPTLVMLCCMMRPAASSTEDVPSVSEVELEPISTDLTTVPPANLESENVHLRALTPLSLAKWFYELLPMMVQQKEQCIKYLAQSEEVADFIFFFNKMIDYQIDQCHPADIDRLWHQLVTSIVRYMVPLVGVTVLEFEVRHWEEALHRLDCCRRRLADTEQVNLRMGVDCPDSWLERAHRVMDGRTIADILTIDTLIENLGALEASRRYQTMEPCVRGLLKVLNRVAESNARALNRDDYTRLYTALMHRVISLCKWDQRAGVGTIQDCIKEVTSLIEDCETVDHNPTLIHILSVMQGEFGKRDR